MDTAALVVGLVALATALGTLALVLSGGTCRKAGKGGGHADPS